MGFSSLFFVVFVGGVLCLFYLYDTCLWFCLFWACESGVSLAGRVIFFFCMGSAVWNVGPVQFIWALAWGGWRGCTGFLLFGFCCGEYGTIYLSAGRGWVAGLYRFFSGIIFCLVLSKLLILF